jgi:hypothetical protein
VREEALAKLSPQEAEAMRAVLAANKDKNFVQRVTNASDWPVVENPGGGYSSHKMGTAEVEGRNIAFPTLTYDPAANALAQPADPVREAMQTGEYIEFPDQAAAEKFAGGGYKAGMDTGLMQKMLHPEVAKRMWK